MVRAALTAARQAGRLPVRLTDEVYATLPTQDDGRRIWLAPWVKRLLSNADQATTSANGR